MYLLNILDGMEDDGDILDPEYEEVKIAIEDLPQIQWSWKDFFSITDRFQ